MKKRGSYTKLHIPYSLNLPILITRIIISVNLLVITKLTISNLRLLNSTSIRPVKQLYGMSDLYVESMIFQTFSELKKASGIAGN